MLDAINEAGHRSELLGTDLGNVSDAELDKVAGGLTSIQQRYDQGFIQNMRA